jgi:hypothetical protein
MRQLAVDVAGLQALARLEPLVERAQHLGRAARVGVADHGEPVAAAQDLHAERSSRIARCGHARRRRSIREVVGELQGGLALDGGRRTR